MKTREELHDQLAAWLRAHYYDEDYELAGSFAQFQQGLEEADRATLRTVIAERLAREPSMVDAMLAGLAGAKEAAPVLNGLLERETEAGMMARALVHALAALDHVAAYATVERFLESDLEMEAFLCLARLDFPRAVHHILRGEKRPHIRQAHLLALNRHRARHGMEALAADLRAAASAHPRGGKVLEKLLTDPEERHNPFNADEAAALVRAVSGG